MYTQFFGNYLINERLITPAQLMEAINEQSDFHVKLGVLAIHSGFMTSDEVDYVHIKQTHIDKRFGEIAVDEGYLTQEQVDSLLKNQTPHYLLLSQILVDKGYLTMEQFQNALIKYQSKYELNDIDFSNVSKEQVDELIHGFFEFGDVGKNITEMLYKYITLLFNNIIRFIGDDFTPFPIVKIGAYPINWCVSQKLTGDFFLHTALDMEEKTLISFASRYVDSDFSENDEYVKASIEDFLNLHNGLFAVNISNTISKEIALEAPITENDVLFVPDGPLYYIPIQFPFGTVNFIFVL